MGSAGIIIFIFIFYCMHFILIYINGRKKNEYEHLQFPSVHEIGTNRVRKVQSINFTRNHKSQIHTDTDRDCFFGIVFQV